MNERERALTYWANECKFQLVDILSEEEEDIADEVDKMSSQEIEELCLDVSDSLLEDEYLWGFINDCIDEYIRDLIKERRD